jgi:hypothetical protein
MLQSAPGQRPGAKKAAVVLRAAWATRDERRRGATSRTTLRERTPHAALAAVFVAGSTILLPFFPTGWPYLLAALAGFAALLSPRAGLAAALAAPVLPLGNVSLGLALLYLPLALGWLALFARDARSGLVFLAGPLLAPLHALALVPVLALRARGVLRRAFLAVASVLTAIAVAMITRSPFPLAGEPPLPGVGLVGGDSPGSAATEAARALTERPGPALAALALAVAAATGPCARRRGLWAVACWASALLAALVLAPLAAGTSASQAIPVTLAVWTAAAVLAFPLLRRG